MPPTRKDKNSRASGPYTTPITPVQPALAAPSSSRGNGADRNRGNIPATGSPTIRSFLADGSKSSSPKQSDQQMTRSPTVQRTLGLSSSSTQSSTRRQTAKTLKSSSGHKQTNQVIQSPPPSPENPANAPFVPTQDPTYIRVCGPVTDAGDFKWPLINRLCYLTPSEVTAYNTAFFWVHVGLEPVLKRPDSKGKKGYWWDGVLRHFNERNPWSCITGGRSLAETYNRHRKTMRTLVGLHNARIEGQTIDQRVETTTRFMRLAREQTRSKEDHPGEVEARKREKLTLCAVECDLIVWYHQGLKDGTVKRVERKSPAPGPTANILLTDFSGESLDDFYKGVKKTLAFRKEVNNVMEWGCPKDESDHGEGSGGESDDEELGGTFQIAQPRPLPISIDSESSDSSDSDSEEGSGM